jgi:hypothetical protein
VENVDEEGSSPVTKKQKMTAPKIMETKDVDMPYLSSIQKEQCPRQSEKVGSTEAVPSSHMNGAAMPLTAAPVPAVGSPRSFFGLKSSIPKEPSKLRFSIQPDKDEKEGPTADDARSRASLLNLDELPLSSDFSYEPWVVESYSVAGARAAQDLAVSKLHTYDFSFPSIDSESKATESDSSAGSQSSVGMSAAAPVSGGGFNWAAAGMKAPEVRSKGAWTCSTCLCSNTLGDAEKCSVCDTPR